MKPSALRKALEKRNYFTSLFGQLPGNAALLQHGRAGVTDTELPNPAAFLARQHPFRSTPHKAFTGT